MEWAGKVGRKGMKVKGISGKGKDKKGWFIYALWISSAKLFIFDESRMGYLKQLDHVS